MKAGVTVPKAECPICLEQIGVRLDGTFRRHGTGWGSTAWCAGSGTKAPTPARSSHEHHVHECQHCPAHWDEEVDQP